MTSNYVEPNTNSSTATSTISTNTNNNNQVDQKSMERGLKSSSLASDNKSNSFSIGDSKIEETPNIAKDKIELAAKHAEMKSSDKTPAMANDIKSSISNTAESVKQKLTDAASVASLAVKDLEEKVAPKVESLVNSIKQTLSTNTSEDNKDSMTVDSTPASTATTPRGDAKMDTDMKKMNMKESLDKKEMMDTSTDAKSAKRKLEERGEKLEETQAKSSKLEEGAQDLLQGATKLKDKMKQKAGL